MQNVTVSSIAAKAVVVKNPNFKAETDIEKIRLDQFSLCIRLLSPLHLGAGDGDVNVDAEVVHDSCGMPYFPAKRFKGMLYESALEVCEMFSECGVQLFSKDDVDRLFQHRIETDVQLIIENMYLKDYSQMSEEWEYLEHAYGNVFSRRSLLDTYTSLRYQTKMDPDTGTAAHTSLHNMRVVDEGLEFYGNIVTKNVSRKEYFLLALALRNLQYAGLKRNHGFGEISCCMLQGNKEIGSLLVRHALEEGGIA